LFIVSLALAFAASLPIALGTHAETSDATLVGLTGGTRELIVLEAPVAVLAVAATTPSVAVELAGFGDIAPDTGAHHFVALLIVARVTASVRVERPGLGELTFDAGALDSLLENAFVACPAGAL